MGGSGASAVKSTTWQVRRPWTTRGLRRPSTWTVGTDASVSNPSRIERPTRPVAPASATVLLPGRSHDALSVFMNPHGGAVRAHGNSRGLILFHSILHV